MPENNFNGLNDLALIEEAALQAGKIALKYFGHDPEMWYKGNARSPVSEADIEIDQYLKKTLLHERCNYGWLSEEIEDDKIRLNKDFVFVVDPIDGTRAFLANTDEWCVSIAIVHKGRPVAGVLYAPVRDICYKAVKGQGAFVKGKRYLTNENDDLSRVIIPDEVKGQVAPSFQKSVQKVGGLRSLALRLATLLDGSADGIFVRKNSSDWDLAAADIIIEEAGFKLVDSAMNDVIYNKDQTTHGVLLATKPKFISAMVNALESDR